MEVLTVNLPLFTKTAVLLLRLVIRPFFFLFFFSEFHGLFIVLMCSSELSEWLSWLMYDRSIPKECIQSSYQKIHHLSHYQRMHSIMAYMERLIIAQCQKNRVQLSSPVTNNERYKHIISCSLRFVFQILLADCILSVFTKYFISKTCFIISYVQITKLLLITFKYLFYQEIWIINHWKNCFIFNTLILWIHFKNHKKYNYTVCWEIFAIVLFLPLLPLLSASNFTTGLIPMYRIISYLSLK